MRKQVKSIVLFISELRLVSKDKTNNITV